MTENNPYKPTASNSTVTREYRPTLRDHPVRALLFSIILGMTSGLAVAGFTVLFGAHGGLPSVGYYTLGPATWLWRLNVGAPSVFTLAGGTCVAWIAYWWFALVGTAKLSVITRLIAISVFHLSSVALYQLMFGLP